VNGILYVAGGQNLSAFLATVEAYHPATNSWMTKASMPAARYNTAGAVVNGVFYVVGGINTSATLLSTLEAYQP
jgi:hypothetical protein